MPVLFDSEKYLFNFLTQLSRLRDNKKNDGTKSHILWEGMIKFIFKPKVKVVNNKGGWRCVIDFVCSDANDLRKLEKALDEYIISESKRQSAIGFDAEFSLRQLTYIRNGLRKQINKVFKRPMFKGV